MIESFSVIFISIFLEAMPFVMLGTLLSSSIEVFLPPDWIEQRFGERKWWRYLLAGLIGIVFPVCECAIVPIMRRLVKKGMPLSLGITFMLATPIVNPVVLMSTAYAFNDGGRMAAYRGIFGYMIAVVIGMIIARYDKKRVLLAEHAEDTCCSHDHGCGCGHDHHHGNDGSALKVVHEVLRHTGKEIMDVGRFLIFGAFITALMQTLVPRTVFITLSDNVFASVVLMMILAFVLSLCSEADAFIASSFATQFPSTALLAFMVFGPMIDIKNTMMLAGTFRKAFVIRLITVITAVVFTVMLAVGMTGLI